MKKMSKTNLKFDQTQHIEEITQTNPKSTKAITLVALIITIIVLLILAGVAISLTVDQDNLFGKANNAASQWNAAVGKEQDILESLEEYIGGQANAPVVKEGMIPVYYDNGWKKADKEKDNWYSYDTVKKQWANVVTVKETGTKTREEYMNAGEGEAIAEEDILAMFVWIPRYAYKITSGYHSMANRTGQINNETYPEGDIQIKFLEAKTDNYGGGTALRQVDTNAKTNGNKYVVHPSFTASNIGEEIEGMWIGKFESSNASTPYNNEGITASSSDNMKRGLGNGTIKDVTIKPNVTAWRGTAVPDMYDVCQKMNDDENIHGLTSQTDTMLMKNSQWGAVAYLAQSNYGNKQIASDNTSGIWNNPYTEGYIYENVNNTAGYGMENYSTTLTGMVGETRDTGTNYYSRVIEGSKQDKGESITIKYNNINKVENEGGPNGKPGSEFTRTFYRYNTAQGVKGSTTRNIYGIYDMSGGVWEYMSSFLTNGTTTYVGTMKAKPAKYIELYEGTGATDSEEDRKANYEANQNKYGDAVWETSNGSKGQYSWNDDYSYFPYLSIPFFVRGGYYHNGSTAGVFYFYYAYGGSYNYCGFRAVAL